MRIVISLSGIVVAVAGILLYLDLPFTTAYFQSTIFVVISGGVNFVLGLATANAGGVTSSSRPQDPVRMVVDRGVIGTTIYLMAFSNKKLVLKRLTSGSVTVLAVIAFAVGGLILAGPIGAPAGGLTAFSLQEFLTQRKRNEVEGGDLMKPSGKGDLEFDYDDIERVAMSKSRLRLYLSKGVLPIVVSRRYPARMWPILENIMPTKTKETA